MPVVTATPDQTDSAATDSDVVQVPPAPPAPKLGPLFGRPLLWALFAAVMLAIPTAALVLTPAPSKLPVLSVLPPFNLVDQSGRPFGRGDLLGKVWVADFIFTSCRSICPTLTGHMQGLQKWLDAEGRLGDVSLLSITVDPETDTPAKLKTYGDQFGARHDVWRFVTGPADGVRSTVVDGFRIAVDRQAVKRPASEGEVTDVEVVHGGKFVLVDRHAQIRGYYDTEDADDLARLKKDLVALQRSRP